MDFLLGQFRDGLTNTALPTIIACPGGRDHRPRPDPAARSRYRGDYASRRRPNTELPRLTPLQPDRGDERAAALIARPGVVDAAAKVELGLLCDQQDAAAVGAFRPAQILGRKHPG